MTGIVAEHAAQLGDADVETLLLDGGVPPNGVEQLVTLDLPGAIQYNPASLTWRVGGTPIPKGTPVQVPLGGMGFAGSCPSCPGTLAINDTGARLCSTASGHKADLLLDVAGGTLLKQYPDSNDYEALVKQIPPASMPGQYQLRVDFHVCDNGKSNGYDTMLVEYLAPTVTPTFPPTSTPTQTAVPTQTPTAASTPSVTPTPPAPTATAVSTSTPTATAATPTPTPTPGGFSWLLNGTAVSVVTGLSNSSPTTYNLPPDTRTLALVDPQGRFCYEAGLVTLLTVGTANGPVVGTYPPPPTPNASGSTAGTLYVASIPAGTAGTSADLYITTPVQPDCNGGNKTFVFPNALAYEP